MNFTDEIKWLDGFQAVTNDLINAVHSRIDDSWIEISKNFDSEKLRKHEEFVAVFDRFIEGFKAVEEIDSTLRYFNDDDDS